MIAALTLTAIQQGLARDNGAAYARHLRLAMAECEDAYREPDGERTHLGASIVGRSCPREVWYSFRWAITGTFNERLYRLWNRGHLEEGRFVALLMSAGLTVYRYDPVTRRQHRVSGHLGHYGGSADGIVLGVPEAPGVPMLCEFKTHGDKSFKSLVADGVDVSKPEHFVQMQMYMGGLGLARALYLAVNKNDDTLHAEIIDFWPETYQRYHERAGRLVWSQFPPKRISESPGWYQCKRCSYCAVCHLNAPLAKNCRTCHYILIDGSEWHCAKYTRGLDRLAQLSGCATWHPLRQD